MGFNIRSVSIKVVFKVLFYRLKMKIYYITAGKYKFLQSI